MDRSYYYTFCKMLSNVHENCSHIVRTTRTTGASNLNETTTKSKRKRKKEVGVESSILPVVTAAVHQLNLHNQPFQRSPQMTISRL